MPSVPQTLAPCFPEYDLHQMDLERNASVVIERTLEHGGRAEFRWLVGHYGIDRIRQVVRERGSRHLSARAFAFWSLILDVSDPRPHPWLNAAKAVWPYRG